MMIKIPRLSEKDGNNIEEMKKTNGWKLMHDIIAESIKIQNIDIINFNWEFDENGEPNKKSIMKFMDLQKEVGILKEFLLFIEKPVIINKEEKNSIYE